MYLTQRKLWCDLRSVQYKQYIIVYAVQVDWMVSPHAYTSILFGKCQFQDNISAEVGLVFGLFSENFLKL